MAHAARFVLLFPALLGAGCFVSEGNCVNNGVSVTPCTAQLRPGQTAQLRASVLGAPGEPVDWILPQAAEGAFEAQANGNELTLISKLNVPASFPVQASSQKEPTFFGGAVVGVSAATFGAQPPPFFFFGGGFPVGSKAAATAAGGNLYYVAFADAGGSLQASASLQPGEQTNFFVKRYGLADNALLADVPDQFLAFTGQFSTPIVPNIVVDCAGTAYWIDYVTQSEAYVLRRLVAGSSVVSEQVLLDSDGELFMHIRGETLAVGCDGAIYFVATQTTEQTRLWRTGFGSPTLQVVVQGFPFIGFSYGRFAVDAAGRLLAGPENFEGGDPLLRLVVELQEAPGSGDSSPFFLATVDPTFSPPDLDRVLGIALDAQGAIYVAHFDFSVHRVSALNTLGEQVYVLESYVHQCPPGCTAPTCGTAIPFHDIGWIGATPAGGLRIVDRIPPPDEPDPACDESVRLILFDPQ